MECKKLQTWQGLVNITLLVMVFKLWHFVVIQVVAATGLHCVIGKLESNFYILENIKYSLPFSLVATFM
jgi:hypothetical protein